jgi:chromate transporter
MLMPASFERARVGAGGRAAVYLLAGAVAAATVGAWLVLVLLGCGLAEIAIRRSRELAGIAPGLLAPIAAKAAALPSIVWVALKVGALAFGGGFVIVPLMQGDAVGHYHWMSSTRFLDAVALGQVTPGPVVQTVAAVGYAAGGVGAGLLASAVAFAPSFAFVLLGGPGFDRLRGNRQARAFLAGAGPAAIGAILGSAIPLAGAIHEAWQAAVLAGATVLLLVLRRGVVPTLLIAALAGLLADLAGAAIP